MCVLCCRFVLFASQEPEFRLRHPVKVRLVLVSTAPAMERKEIFQEAEAVKILAHFMQLPHELLMMYPHVPHEVPICPQCNSNGYSSFTNA